MFEATVELCNRRASAFTTGQQQGSVATRLPMPASTVVVGEVAAACRRPVAVGPADAEAVVAKLIGSAATAELEAGAAVARLVATATARTAAAITDAVEVSSVAAAVLVEELLAGATRRA